MDESLGQSHNLYFKNFFATLVQGITLWNEWMCLNRTSQNQVTLVHQFGTDMNSRLVLVLGHVGGESSVVTTFVADTFYINFADDELFLQRETFGCSQERTIFVNQSVAAEYHIGSRFTETTRTEYIATQATGRLLAEKRTQVSLFTNAFGYSSSIENNFSALQRKVGTWWNRCPYIFAHFDAKACFGCIEQEVGTKSNVLSTKSYICFGMVGCR